VCTLNAFLLLNIIGSIKSKAFTLTEFSETFKSYQPLQVVDWRVTKLYRNLERERERNGSRNVCSFTIQPLDAVANPTKFHWKKAPILNFGLFFFIPPEMANTICKPVMSNRTYVGL
jgi:hypothetical protein